MNDRVAAESYVERWQREQKEKMGIPFDNEKGILVKPETDILPEESNTEDTDCSSNQGEELTSKRTADLIAETIEKKEVKEHGKNTGSEGQTTPTEGDNGE